MFNYICILKKTKLSLFKGRKIWLTFTLHTSNNSSSNLRKWAEKLLSDV